MKKQVFESPIGESYIKAEHPSGLKIYIMEKPHFSSNFAIFGTKYGSIDTAFSKNGEAEIFTQTWSGNIRMIKCAEKLGFEE